MFLSSTDFIFVSPGYRELLDSIRFDGKWVFQSPRVKVWRKLQDRENATFTLDTPEGTRLFHVKRYPRTTAFRTAAQDEYRAYLAMLIERLPVPHLVAYGKMADRASFIITEQLYDHAACDKLIAAGTPFDLLLNPTADLAADLHNSGLHHQDLYLCHFFADVHDGTLRGLKLIDLTRVDRMNFPLARRRWVVKDLGQFWYSTLALPVTDAQRDAWLARYAERRQIARVGPLKQAVLHKARVIAAHDKKLSAREPTRHASIPTT